MDLFLEFLFLVFFFFSFVVGFFWAGRKGVERDWLGVYLCSARVAKWGIGEQFVVELGRSGARGASFMTIVLLFFFIYYVFTHIM